MKTSYETDRLILNLISTDDSAFISELLNSPGWIKFIGDRNIKNNEDAVRYIQKIIDNPLIRYWVVRTIEHRIPIGIITLIKRDYLEHHDIGFAFLPQCSKRGYAYEASSIVLNDLLKKEKYPIIFATTLIENINSIHLLEKLGLKFEKEILVENEKLLVYSISK